MIPSVLGQQIRTGVREFLLTTFPITNRWFENAMETLLDTPGQVFRGPYLSLKLPFTKSGSGKRFFPEIVPADFHPHKHQETAWERLDWRVGKSTVVATGTGSGKTECFLFPILDYCYAQRQQPGIKAILIYPMNALATDQAKRLEKMLRRNEKLSSLRAGLYLGEPDGSNSEGMTGSPLMVNRAAMRDTPPDILLTNYKMLDYLLLRQKDARLWQQNQPDTLRYLVIDELHTFDGAQGSDVACLIRRLKERLRTPEGQLICVGTSATLGGDAETASGKLSAYAQKVFGEAFDAKSVIGESVQSPEEFFREYGIEYAGAPGPDAKRRLDPLEYGSLVEYIDAQRRLWGLPESGDLAGQLRRHGFLRRLLALTGNAPVSLELLVERLAPSLAYEGPVDDAYIQALLASFLSLISESRTLQVRLQFWMRELARVVSSLKRNPKLAFASDLKHDQLKHSLAVIHCRECGLTGWCGTIKDQDDYVNPDLDTLYRAFFDNRPEVAFLFPGDVGVEQPGTPTFLCAECLHIALADMPAECKHCGAGADRAIRVWIPETNVTVQDGDGQKRKGLHDCKACDSRNSLTIVGSRAASLTSVMISQLWASPFYPPEKKLLAFSDNVQDASHRAGFFKGRTFRFNLRTAVQRVVQSAGPISLAELGDQFIAEWQSTLRKPEDFVALFLAPDKEWLDDFEQMRRKGRLPAGSDLPELVNKRLKWEIWSEYTHSARIGRSLEKTGSSVCDPDGSLVGAALARIAFRLENEIGGFRNRGLSGLDWARFVYGFLMNLKNRGGVWQYELKPYLSSLGTDTYQMTRVSGRERYMPPLAPQSRLPVFVVDPGKGRFLPLVSGSASSPSWHTKWLQRNFGVVVVDFTRDVYRTVIEELIHAGVMFEEKTGTNEVWGITDASLSVSTQVAQLRCDR